MNDQELHHSLKEYVESGNYFKDAVKWYESKYLYPFSQRSFVLTLALVVLILLTGVSLYINSLFPLTLQVKYSIQANVAENKAARITRADQIREEALASVTDIMIRNYIHKRESYIFSDLKLQFTYIKNNSTRIMFRRFYNNMSIDNPSSPVLRFRKAGRREITILDTNYPERSKAQVRFASVGINENGELIENIVWLATIGYEIDKIDPNLPPGTRYNFTVTSYEAKLLQDKLKS